ncbi:hypothetical protein SAICODRAFT_68562 [Saitoella complicata NRRL Y-17804]|nr:uncharacterized protein SAICODRAFT_68562 [Saitoella complicata NRRL Y-17804]ODQ56187.1 hypothetical protein SAICODRAFT_68562 [Saitoella complicata NRRL Y-17804]
MTQERFRRCAGAHARTRYSARSSVAHLPRREMPTTRPKRTPSRSAKKTESPVEDGSERVASSPPSSVGEEYGSESESEFSGKEESDHEEEVHGESEEDVESEDGEEEEEEDERPPTKKRKVATPKPTMKSKTKKATSPSPDDADDATSAAGSGLGSTFIPRIPSPSPGDTPYKPHTLHPNSLSFLSLLSKNNDRTWFQPHESHYHASKRDFESFIDTLQHRLTKIDDTVPLLPVRDLVYRIYRDVRFSNDRTPYKTYFAAGFGRMGRKGGVWAGYYLSVQPGGKTFVAGGKWHPDSVQLGLLRRMIDKQGRALKKLKAIIEEEGFKELFGGLDELCQNEDRLKVAPKGYPKDHPEIALLKLKGIGVSSKRWSDEEVCGEGFLEEVVEALRKLVPLVEFLNGVCVPELEEAHNPQRSAISQSSTAMNNTVVVGLNAWQYAQFAFEPITYAAATLAAVEYRPVGTPTAVTLGEKTGAEIQPRKRFLTSSFKDTLRFLSKIDSNAIKGLYRGAIPWLLKQVTQHYAAYATWAYIFPQCTTTTQMVVAASASDVLSDIVLAPVELWGTASIVSSKHVGTQVSPRLILACVPRLLPLVTATSTFNILFQMVLSKLLPDAVSEQPIIWQSLIHLVLNYSSKLIQSVVLRRVEVALLRTEGVETVVPTPEASEDGRIYGVKQVGLVDEGYEGVWWVLRWVKPGLIAGSIGMVVPALVSAWVGAQEATY